MFRNNMSEIQIPVYEPIISCRYCLSEDNEEDLVDPCKCKGTTKYVHKKCLTKWFENKNNRVVIPGAFNQFNFSCEICHTKYKFQQTEVHSKSQLWYEIFIYISCITTVLLLSYIAVGWLMQQSVQTTQLFTQRGTHWENVFYNGFIMVHIILAIFYIMLAIFTLVNSQNSDTCLCCYFSQNCNGCDEGCAFCIIVLIIIGIFGTVLIIYYDIINRVLQRDYNKSHIISDIQPYTEY
jgi:E3 ubiquitin-protein ligase DOA10